MKQQILSFLLALLPLAASADAVEIDGIYYNLLSKLKTAEVTSNPNKYTGTVTIPETITYNSVKYNVTSIGDRAFWECSGLTSITIPNSVTSIGYWAFERCSGLTSVIIDNSVTDIGNLAFEGTAWYNNQPDGLVYAGLVAYKYKGTMSSNCNVILKEGTVGIASCAFEGCSGLTSITIPNSVTSIGGAAFRDCSGLAGITIPNSVTSIGGSAFSGCSGLTSVTIGNSVASIGEQTFYNCSGLTCITIPNSVTSIGGSAFGNCSGLTSITIPNSVTSIGNYVFSGCSNLTSITIPNSVTSIGGSAFYECSGLTSITIPNSVTSIEADAFYECSGLTSIAIPNSVTIIGERAFKYCRSLTSITIPNSVTSIGKSAFDGCTSLTSISIPNSVSSIEDGTFNSCGSLTSITIPSSVIRIGVNAFSYCSALTSITIPNSVTNIGKYAFYGCGGLTTITIGSGVKIINESAFARCQELADVYCYARTVPSTSDNAFSDSYIEYATLHVSEVAMENYKNTAPWGGFQNIVSIENGGQLFHMTVSVNNTYGKVAYGTTEITNSQLLFYVKEGSDVVLTLTPNKGFKVSKVIVNGEDRTADVADRQLNLSNVTDNLIVSVSFGVAGDFTTITIGDEGMVTFCPIGDVDFTSVNGVKAYIGSIFNRETGVLTMTRAYDVPAGTGLLIKGESRTYEIPLKQSNSIVSNLLKGVVTATNVNATENGYVNYVLNNGSQGVGFYKVGTAGAILEAGRAYLQIQDETATSRTALKLRFDDEDEATGISASLTKSEEVNSAMYDLQGRRVEQPQPGLYIRNGKKVIIK